MREIKGEGGNKGRRKRAGGNRREQKGARGRGEDVAREGRR